MNILGSKRRGRHRPRRRRRAAGLSLSFGARVGPDRTTTEEKNERERERKKSFLVVTGAGGPAAAGCGVGATGGAAAWPLGVAGSPIRPAEPNTAPLLLLTGQRGDDCEWGGERKEKLPTWPLSLSSCKTAAELYPFLQWAKKMGRIGDFHLPSFKVGTIWSSKWRRQSPSATHKARGSRGGGGGGRDNDGYRIELRANGDPPLEDIKPEGHSPVRASTGQRQ